MRTFLIVVVAIALTIVVIGTWACNAEDHKDVAFETNQESVTKTETEKEAQKVTQKETKKETTDLDKWETTDHIYVKGEIIGFEDPADVVFEILKRNGVVKISEPDVLGDGTVTHHYKINNKYVNITFERSYGQYRITKIRCRNE